MSDGRPPADDEAHPRTDAHPRATQTQLWVTRRRRTQRDRTTRPGGVVPFDRTRPQAGVDNPSPFLFLMADDSTPTELGTIDKLELLHDTTAPLPNPPCAPVHDDNPDRWGANLNAYNKLRDT
ncbi:unnamed protein product [Closterium sp. NIES-64]|nr:unnamed protein product [Closterium sp. NIES-64]